ncbi:MAG: M20/M25/M40 family metallo-hydrolase [Bryobacterales bacterium]|nr:M20/M25/M40 family metallo-hydrolase [Bryobacterales bacterium]
MSMGLLLALTQAIAADAAAAGRSRVSITRMDAPDAQANHLRADIEALASEEFGGRALGSPGADKAAAFVEARFRELGLEPAPGIGYQQQFPVRLNLKLPEAAAQNGASVAGPASRSNWTLHKDFLPLPFSANGKWKDAPLVFAGYAIHAPELGYDDFQSIDVRGKVVIAFRREPQERKADSRFVGLDFTAHASFAAKARAVAQRGAKALLIVTNRLPAEEESELPAFAGTTGPAQLPIPVVAVRASAIAPFFTEQGLSLSALQRRIDDTGAPQSFAFPAAYRMSISVRIDGQSAKGGNVLGWLPGHPSNGDYVVVGAHFDHVGRGERFSMEGGPSGKLHPGADDNASGVAAMLELARLLSRRHRDGRPPSRSILFVAFGGEEHGLFGSAHFLHQQPVPGRRLAGMINFDMVGRLRNEELFMAGLDSVPEIRELANSAANSAGLSLQALPEYPYNMSDHGTFLDAGVPAVLFFTGLHLEYHTPRDTADRVDENGIARILKVAEALLAAMTAVENPLRFQGGANPAYERSFREAVLPPNPYDFE